MKLIDVSYHQKNIDFDKVRKSGIEGVIIRAGYGQNNIDQKFNQYIQNAIKVGMHIGIYWFSYAYTEDMARHEALYCLQAIEPYRKYIDLPIFFDWEYDSYDKAQEHGISPSKTLITQMNVVFCETIKKSGYMAGYYVNLDYSKNYVNEDKLKQYKRWYARYISTPQTNNCYLWQYNTKGKVPGISVAVDMDILNVPLPKKSVDELVVEVLKGFWGNGADRKKRLTEAGYDYRQVQDAVNRVLKNGR